MSIPAVEIVAERQKKKDEFKQVSSGLQDLTLKKRQLENRIALTPDDNERWMLESDLKHIDYDIKNYEEKHKKLQYDLYGYEKPKGLIDWTKYGDFHAPDETSYLGGAAIGMNKGVSTVVKAIEGGQKIVEDLTGLNFNPQGTKPLSTKIVENAENTFKHAPENLAGKVVEGAAEMVPDMAVAAMFPAAKLKWAQQVSNGLVTEIPKFTSYFTAKTALNKYEETGSAKEAVEAGVKAVPEATLMHMLGYSGAKVGEMASAASKSDLIGKTAGALWTSLAFTGTEALNKYLSGEKITKDELAESFGKGFIFSVPHIAEAAMKKATTTFFTTPKEDIQKIMDNPQTAEELRDKATKLAEDAADEKDVNKKNEMQTGSIILGTAADTKGIVNIMKEDPAPFKEDVASSDIPDESKKHMIDKIDITVADQHPGLKAAKPHIDKIKSIKAEIKGIEDSSIGEEEKKLLTTAKEEEIKALEEKASKAFSNPPKPKVETNKTEEDAIQKQSASSQVSHNGETGKNKPQDSEGVGQSKQGEKSTAEGKKEVVKSPEQTFEEINNLIIKSDKDGLTNAERKEFNKLLEDEGVKYIHRNFEKLIERKGITKRPC